MANSNEYYGNTFANNLYDAIYGSMSNYIPLDMNRVDAVRVKLESPLKEQFISLFVEMKMRKYETEPIDANFVLRVCHKLLECQKYVEPIPPKREYDREETESSQDHFIPPVNRDNDRVVTCSGGRTSLDMLEFESDFNQAKELRQLHNLIKNYLTAENCGRVARALKCVLASFLQEEINSYFVNVKERSCDDFSRARAADYTQRHGVFLNLGHHVTLSRIRYFTEIASNATGKSGCDLISALILWGIRDTAGGEAILNEIAKPVQAMISRWMAVGEVNDEHGEFFIVKGTPSKNGRDDGYVLSSTNTLNFLNASLLDDIYQTGKNMGFLLRMLGSKTNANVEKIQENVVGLADQDGLLVKLADNNRGAKFSMIISDARAQSSALLMGVLIDQYDLLLQLEGFRNYMLFGRGDFYAYVVSKLEPHFGYNEMHYYQLKDIMEDAYDLTSAKNDDKKLFDNLRYKIDQTGEVNWKSFKFKYVANEQLDRIFGGQCFNSYASVFEFLWRLKSIHWTTNKTWHQIIDFAKKSYDVIELKLVIRNINALLSNMLSLVSEIQNFIFQSINNEWERFKSETRKATCLKAVTDAHMSLLESITKSADDATASLEAYTKLFQNQVDEFANIFQCFVYKSSSGDSGEIQSYNDEYDKNKINAFLDDFRGIKTAYETGLCDLLSRLAKSETRGLGTLAPRINFSGYYTPLVQRRRQEQEINDNKNCNVLSSRS